MRILVEQSGHHLKNMGDVAMLQVAISRLKELWSHSEIYVLTTAPDLLDKYCPGTYPLSPLGRDIWASSLSQYKTRHNLYNKLVDALYQSGLEWKLRKYSPDFTRFIFQYLLRRSPDLIEEFKKFSEIFFSSDLIVATGGGYINDIFPYNTNGVLTILGLGVSLKKTTAMFGHGLGPLNDQEIIEKSRAVLPFVNLISLREKRAGLPLLESLSTASERIITTGDDAIELAYKARKEMLGNGIGINLRVSYYSAVGSEVLEAIRIAIHKIVSLHSAPLVPVPISRYSAPGYESPDSVAIQQLIEGFGFQTDEGYHLDTPLKVIENTALCRVVVTASYHAAVFALAQGIPVVGLAKSEYYIDKFLGLSDQFTTGCNVIYLNDPDFEEKLTNSIEHLWHEAEDLRPKLLEAAEKQIALSRMAYKKVYELVRSR